MRTQTPCFVHSRTHTPTRTVMVLLHRHRVCRCATRSLVNDSTEKAICRFRETPPYANCTTNYANVNGSLHSYSVDLREIGFWLHKTWQIHRTRVHSHIVKHVFFPSVGPKGKTPTAAESPTSTTESTGADNTGVNRILIIGLTVSIVIFILILIIVLRR